MKFTQSLANGTYSGPATLQLSKTDLIPGVRDLLMQMGWTKDDSPDDFFLHCENSVIETDKKWLYLKSRQYSTQIELEKIKDLSLSARN
jgi:hypothetical protein